MLLFSFCVTRFFFPLPVLTVLYFLFVGRNIISTIYFFVSIVKKRKKNKQNKQKKIPFSLSIVTPPLWLIPASSFRRNRILKQQQQQQLIIFSFFSVLSLQIICSCVCHHLCTVYMTLGKESMRDDVKVNQKKTKTQRVSLSLYSK